MKKIIFILGILLISQGICAQKVTRGKLMQLFYSAQKYQQGGDNEGAIKSYKEIVRLAPRLPEPHLALGFLYSTNEDDASTKLALQSYRKYIELSPNNAQRDSISHIVSAMERLVKSSSVIDEAVLDQLAVPESVAENDANTDAGNREEQPEYKFEEQPEYKKDVLKTFSGKWISDRFVQSTMIPQWVFDISYSDSVYKISFHSASQRYSKYLDAKVKKPVLINDSCLFIRFARPEIYTPSTSGYYVKSITTQVSNPLFVYSVTGQEKEINPAELAERQKSHKELMDKLTEATKNDKPEQRETIEELTIDRLSEYAFLVHCKEILKIQQYNEEPVVTEDIFETVFYKIPDDMPFIMLGRDNYLITNNPATDEETYKKAKPLMKNYKEQAQKQTPETIKNKTLLNHLVGIDSIGYHQWYSKQESKNILKTIGNGLINVASVAISAVAVNQFAAVDSFGGMILQWLSESVYSKNVNSLSMFCDDIDNKLKINPKEWNTKMYQSLLDYYGNDETVNMQTVY